MLSGRRDSHRMSSATLHFVHNSLRLPSKSYGNVSKGATRNRPERLFLRGKLNAICKTDRLLRRWPRESQWSCQRSPCHAIEQVDASRSREISDERPLREANAAATGRRLTTVSPDLKVPSGKIGDGRVHNGHVRLRRSAGATSQPTNDRSRLAPLLGLAGDGIGGGRARLVA